MRGDQLDIQESLMNAIDNHLTASLLATFLGFAPAGLVAVYYAARVNALKEEEDIQGALEASRRARRWYRGAILTQIVLVAGYILFLIINTLVRRAWR